MVPIVTSESAGTSPTQRSTQELNEVFYGDSYEESAKERMEKGTTAMKARASLFRTLVVLAVVVLVTVALFGVPCGREQGPY